MWCWTSMPMFSSNDIKKNMRRFDKMCICVALHCIETEQPRSFWINNVRPFHYWHDTISESHIIVCDWVKYISCSFLLLFGCLVGILDVNTNSVLSTKKMLQKQFKSSFVYVFFSSALSTLICTNELNRNWTDVFV